MDLKSSVMVVSVHSSAYHQALPGFTIGLFIPGARRARAMQVIDFPPVSADIFSVNGFSKLCAFPVNERDEAGGNEARQNQFEDVKCIVRHCACDWLRGSLGSCQAVGLKMSEEQNGELGIHFFNDSAEIP